MKIVVPVKQVANLDDDFELLEDGSGVDEAFISLDANEWDAYAVEAAMQLREAAGGGEIVAMTVGDEEAEDVLLSAMARGADRGVRVWDPALRDGDPLAVARVLAAAIATESPDLILCGVQSSDAMNGATGIALAGFLDLPHVAVVTRLELDDKAANVERELEGGLIELLRIRLPALFTIQTGANEPRYATLRAIKQAREKPLVRLAAADIGLEPAEVLAAAGSHPRRLRHHAQADGAQLLEGSEADLASQIVSLVRERLS